MKQPTGIMAEKILKECNAKGVLILCFDFDTYTSVSYGDNELEFSKCESMGKLLDQITDLIESGKLSIWE